MAKNERELKIRNTVTDQRRDCGHGVDHCNAAALSKPFICFDSNTILWQLFSVDLGTEAHISHRESPQVLMFNQEINN